MNRLSDRHRVLAPDLYGYGNSPAWCQHREMTADDEVDLLAPVFEPQTSRLILIGHSWGGAVALKAALKYRSRLKLLILFEPALWSLLINEALHGAEGREISKVRDDSLDFMKQGNWSGAAEHFLCYWTGPDTWNRLGDTRRLSLTGSMPAVRNDWHASFNDPTLLSEFGLIDVPVLLMTGIGSPLPARALVRLLGEHLSWARIVDMAGLGHMAPITHADPVNDMIEEFIMDHNT